MTTVPPPPPAIAPAAGATAKNWMGTVALVAGIVSIPAACCCYGGVPIGAGAIVFGILGKKAVEAGEANNASMAKNGLILGAVGVGVSVILFVLNVVLNVVDFGYSSY